MVEVVELVDLVVVFVQTQPIQLFTAAKILEKNGNSEKKWKMVLVKFLRAHILSMRGSSEFFHN